MSSSKLALFLAVLLIAGCGRPGGSLPVPLPTPVEIVATLPSPTPTSPPGPSSPTPEPLFTVHGLAGPAIYWTDAAGILHEALWSDLRDRTVGTGRARQSPDGSRLAGTIGIVSFDGTQIGPWPDQGDPGGKTRYGWADDSLHLCADFGADPGGAHAPATFYVAALGSPGVAVAQVGSEGGQSGPRVLACSFNRHLAVVEEYCIFTVCELWTLNPETGALLFHNSYPTGTPLLGVSASPDGRFLALINQRTGHSDITTSTSTSVLATLEMPVRSFSGDGSLILVESGADVRVIDWRSGRTVWTGPPQLTTAFNVLAEPRGRRLAVFLLTDSNRFPSLGDIYVIDADGAATRLAAGVRADF